ncbi:MAG: hypothetical protein ACOY0T_36770 [Myxococcota bacterium]
MNSPAKRLDTNLECGQIAPQVVLLVARGRVTRHSMEAQLPVFQNILSRMRRPGWIIDTSDLCDFEPSAVGIGTEWFKAFKAAGGEKVIFVSGLATARMAATTISFAARMPLETSLTLAQACERLGVTHPPSRAIANPESAVSGTRPKIAR